MNLKFEQRNKDWVERQICRVGPYAIYAVKALSGMGLINVLLYRDGVFITGIDRITTGEESHEVGRAMLYENSTFAELLAACKGESK